jgi:hypothetical protein
MRVNNLPSQRWYANLLSFGQENLLLKNPGMVRPPGDVGREYESLRLIFQLGERWARRRNPLRQQPSGPLSPCRALCREPSPVFQQGARRAADISDDLY